MKHVLVIDIGGTKIAAGLCDREGRLSHVQRCATLAHEGSDAILGRIAGLAQQVMAEAQPDAPSAVGVGTGGQVDPADGHIVHATPLLPGWTGLPLWAWMEQALGLPVAVVNDVHAMGLGEAAHGAGQRYQHLLCIAVGTGIGGAYVLSREVYQGAHGGAGHFGHVSIDALSRRRCNCGNVGCVEMYAAAPAIVSDWVQAVGLAQIRRLLGKSPNAIDVADIALLTRRQDGIGEAAYAALHRSGRYVGLALTSLLHALNPDAVVIGGGVAQAGEAFFSGVRQAVKERAMPPFRGVPILPAALGPDAALVGAGVLAWQALARA